MTYDEALKYLKEGEQLCYITWVEWDEDVYRDEANSWIYMQEDGTIMKHNDCCTHDESIDLEDLKDLCAKEKMYTVDYLTR